MDLETLTKKRLTKLRNRIEVFKENPTLGGFSIAVRDDWSFKTKRIHITVAEKEAYVNFFGERIVLENEFMKWWMNFRLENNAGIQGQA